MIKPFLFKFLIVVFFFVILFFVGWYQRDRVVLFLNDNFKEESHQVCMYVLGRLAEEVEHFQLDGLCHIGIIPTVSQAKDRLAIDE